MKIVTFAAGLATGYVLGTRAGRERFDQLVRSARNLGNHPTVVQAQDKVKEALSSNSRPQPPTPAVTTPAAAKPPATTTPTTTPATTTPTTTPATSPTTSPATTTPAAATGRSKTSTTSPTGAVAPKPVTR